MAIRIVDLLKVVNVDHQERKRNPRFCEGHCFGFKSNFKSAPVDQSGEQIIIGDRTEALFELLRRMRLSYQGRICEGEICLEELILQT